MAVALALSLATPGSASAHGPAEKDLPTVQDEPTPPPDETEQVRDEPNLQRAMEAFQRGSQNYNQAKYDVALRDFLEAASLYASPDFQYNIGLCYEKLDKPEEAIAAFETYLKTKPDAPDRANVEDRITRLREMAGRRGKDDGGATTPDTTPAKKDGRSLVIAGAVLTGVGAAIALGGGIGFGIAARKKSRALDDVQNGGNPDDLTFAEAKDLEKQGKRFEAIQIAMAAVGAAVAITGVALLAVGAARGKASAKAPAKRRAMLTPWFGGRGGGLGLTGRF